MTTRDAVYAMLKPYREPGTNDAAVRAWWPLLVELASLRETISTLTAERDAARQEAEDRYRALVTPGSGYIEWLRRAERAEATISTLQGEIQDLRQVVKEYRNICGRGQSDHHDHCEICRQADALLAPKPVAPDQPKEENL